MFSKTVDERCDMVNRYCICSEMVGDCGEYCFHVATLRRDQVVYEADGDRRFCDAGPLAICIKVASDGVLSKDCGVSNVTEDKLYPSRGNITDA